MSKLDEFESFVERIRKYPLLPLTSTEGSKLPVILLIDDLPLTNGKVAIGRLSNCLHVLARSTQIPTVILITEYTKADFSNPTKNNWEELQSSLECAGARKVTFFKPTWLELRSCFLESEIFTLHGLLISISSC